MEYTQCINCLEKYKSQIIQCFNCNSKQLVRYKNGKYVYQGQVFTRGKWYSIISDFYEFNNSLNIRRMSADLTAKYIKQIYQKNIQMFTFLGMILPMIVFSLMSVMSFLTALIVSNKEFILLYNTSAFLFFLAIFFMFIVIVLLVQYYVLGYRCYFTKNQSFQYQYQKISKDTIQENLEILDKYIIKEEEN